MHDATKILIVFCAVLSLLLAALTMAYSANAERVTSALREERALRQAAVADASSQVAEASNERAKLNSQIEALNNEASRLQLERANLQNERSALQVEKEQAIARVAAIQNQIAQLSATADTQAVLIKNYRDEVSGLRSEQLAASKRETEMIDRINELESNREVLEQTARALREQLAEAQLAVQTAQAGGGAVLTNQPFEPSQRFTGTVRRLEKSPRGADLAVIDIGAQTGVKQNMKLSIIRGDTFVANLVIVSADAREAVGEIDRLGRQVDVRVGDRVMSRLN